ncbi:hypothetical protein BJ912DRAFT_1065504 [Pholiota molesta]|nr:hypothetical protein BJ912DRAFT_1065504 [Pholiota molesta]
MDAAALGKNVAFVLIPSPRPRGLVASHPFCQPSPTGHAAVHGQFRSAGHLLSIPQERLDTPVERPSTIAEDDDGAPPPLHPPFALSFDDSWRSGRSTSGWNGQREPAARSSAYMQRQCQRLAHHPSTRTQTEAWLSRRFQALGTEHRAPYVQGKTGGCKPRAPAYTGTKGTLPLTSDQPRTPALRGLCSPHTVAYLSTPPPSVHDRLLLQRGPASYLAPARIHGVQYPAKIRELAIHDDAESTTASTTTSPQTIPGAPPHPPPTNSNGVRGIQPPRPRTTIRKDIAADDDHDEAPPLPHPPFAWTTLLDDGDSGR